MWTSKNYLESKFDEVAELASNGKWEFVTKQYDVVISKQSNSGGKINCMKGAGQIQAKPEQVFEVIWDIPRRKQWDKFVEKASVVRQYDQYTKLTHIILTKPLNSRIVSNRDLCVVCAYKELPNGAILVIVLSVEDDAVPPHDDFIRAELETCGFIIEPDGSDSCWITYIVQMNYKGWLPELLSNRLYQPLRISTLRYCVSDVKSTSLHGKSSVYPKPSRDVFSASSGKVAQPRTKLLSLNQLSLSKSLTLEESSSEEEDGEMEFHEVDEEFCDSIDDMSHIHSHSQDNKSMEVYLQVLRKDIKELQELSSKNGKRLENIEQELEKEESIRKKIQQEREEQETKSEAKIQELLFDYLLRIKETQVHLKQTNEDIQKHKQIFSQRTERLRQSFQLCFSRIRDAGKYQVYWGCAVFFLWCLWPFLLIKRRVSLVGARKLTLGNMMQLFLQLYRMSIGLLFQKFPLLHATVQVLSLPLRLVISQARRSLPF